MDKIEFVTDPCLLERIDDVDTLYTFYIIKLRSVEGYINLSSRNLVLPLV